MVRFPSRLGRPVAWERPPPQPLAGRFRRNQALAGLARLCALPGTFGPESLATPASRTDALPASTRAATSCA